METTNSKINIHLTEIERKLYAINNFMTNDLFCINNNIKENEKHSTYTLTPKNN